MTFLTEAQLIRDNFKKELELTVSGNETSLKFIKQQIPSPNILKESELFQVLVVGGSVFRKALMKKENNELVILQSQEELQPAFTTKDIFLQYLTNQIYSESSIIAINFAYPIAPLIRSNRMDAKLLSSSKENAFEGLVGENVGETIEQYLLERLNKNITVTLANDAICLLLSGTSKHTPESLAGAIMGTGTNITFFHDQNAVNLESGNFNKFTPSEECIEIDTLSKNPGSALFEKEVAGAYLFQHFNKIVKKHSLKIEPLTSTKDLQEVALKSDNVELTKLARLLFEKSSAYFAGQLIGLAEYKKIPLILVLEGSAYWANPLYQQMFGDYLISLTQDYPVTILKVENSPIIGGAKLLV